MFHVEQKKTIKIMAQDYICIGIDQEGRKILMTKKRLEKQKKFQMVYDASKKYSGALVAVSAAVADELGLKQPTVLTILQRINTGEIVVKP